MGGLIGGLFGGGGDSGGSSQPTAGEQLQRNNETLSYQDPNSAVQDYQNKYVQNNNGQPNTLNNMYDQQKKKNSNSFGKQWGNQHGLARFFFMGDE